ncbi:MAG: glycosyltransferase family 1 protein, partial [bacterium]
MVPGTGDERPRILYLDQTGQLGGAELCLLDLIHGRQGQDKVLLFQRGPFEEALRERAIPVQVAQLHSSAGEVRKESGWIEKLAASKGTLRLAKEVADAARDMDVIYANTAKSLVVAALAN